MLNMRKKKVLVLHGYDVREHITGTAHSSECERNDNVYNKIKDYMNRFFAMMTTAT